MAMFRRILVGIDGHPTSRFPLDQAIKMARCEGARLRIVQVVDLGTLEDAEASGIYTLPVENEVTQKAWGDLTKAQSLARRAGVNAETAVLPIYASPISDAIVDDAKQWRADLMVLGTHDRRGVERLLLGSVAEHVARAAPVPVLLVPVAESVAKSA